jgi:hypothetical protein
MLRPEARHVLGVAFPHTDAGTWLDAELEHSFLRLAYSVGRLSRSGELAVGYFVVLRQEVRDAAERLKLRYDAGEAVHIVFTSLLVSDMTRLNEAAEVASIEGDPSALTSVARQIAMETLRREIALQEPDVTECPAQDSQPFGVPWDFYGRTQAPGGRTACNSESHHRLV